MILLITKPITQPITVTQLIILQLQFSQLMVPLRFKDLVYHLNQERQQLDSLSKILRKLFAQEDWSQLTTALTATPKQRTVQSHSMTMRIHAHLMMTTALEAVKMTTLAMNSTSILYQLQLTMSTTTGDTTQPLVPETSLTQSKTLTRLCSTLPTSLVTFQESGLEV